jgi:excisionase family DNA binding protein
MSDGAKVEKCLRKREVAEALGISERNVERLIAAGQLVKIKIGKCTRIPISSVVAFVDRRLAKGAGR